MERLKELWAKKDRVLRTLVQVVGGSAITGVCLALLSVLQSRDWGSDAVTLALVSTATTLLSALMNRGERLRDEGLDGITREGTD